MRYKLRMNSNQCRAARALIKWSQTQLADASGVALSTVADFEIEKREPRSDNLTAIRRALEGAGVEFIPAKSGKGVGVRLREDLPT
jgi:transcriptional regulator with XRE-family HTH domain